MEHCIISDIRHLSYSVSLIGKSYCLRFPRDQISYVTICCHLSIPKVVRGQKIHHFALLQQPHEACDPILLLFKGLTCQKPLLRVNRSTNLKPAWHPPKAGSRSWDLSTGPQGVQYLYLCRQWCLAGAELK